MIWENFAKSYLGAVAAQDIDYLEKIYAKNIFFKKGRVELNSAKSLLDYNRSIFKMEKERHDRYKTININNTAYNGKSIFIEYDLLITHYSSETCESNIDIIRISSLGKIESIKTYTMETI